MNKPRRAPRRRVDGVLLLDKPIGITSNAALQKARWLFNAEKAGHTGTLDPLATGLLPLCFGEATKFAGELLGADKSYRATLKLGVTTDTADAEGKVQQVRPVEVDADSWRIAMADFRGQIEQIPPMHSALKRDGAPLYQYARQGIELEREARQVTVHRLELVSFFGEEAVIDVDCSKGTYVRTLAADIGEKLGCGAHLTALRRTRIGGLDVIDAIPLADLEALSVDSRDNRLLAVDSLLANVPMVRLDSGESEQMRHGQGIRREGPPGLRYRLYATNGAFIGLGEQSADGWLNPRRLIATIPITR
ncbi:MAG: tRNA pseudouridine(55) synthase TruB [Gammaproteobacteria bacterium]|nr:tRNA pseudouridine(55) synthase TruB [Gammaproteobacteria bacterium]MBU1414304.1 tRNA pseudouridine(55) synthase TruB [Gammaproteobacteria bacterium]